MSFSATEFARLRPYLYHLTDARNLPRIMRLRRLDCAAELMSAADRAELVTVRRASHQVISVSGEDVLLRDQAPLHRGNIAFGDGWDFSSFVRLLNERVFFWPGNAHGPNSYGLRHFQRYQHESPVLIRVKTAELFDSNSDRSITFCRYNSGAPRWSRGKAAPRGASTFVSG